MTRRTKAWLVHLFTGSGAVVGLFALDAIACGAYRSALGWMVLSCFIDSVDGTLARRLDIEREVPEFDGAMLDNVIDFFNYAVVPAFFLYRAPLMLPGTQGLAAAAILLSSGYQFSQVEAKTEDHFFLGFPSLWNVLTFYLLISGLAPLTNLALVLICSVLVFVPLKYIYPSRTKVWQARTLTLTMIWLVVELAVVWTYPDCPRILVLLSWAYAAYYLGASWYLNLREYQLHKL